MTPGTCLTTGRVSMENSPGVLADLRRRRGSGRVSHGSRLSNASRRRSVSESSRGRLPTTLEEDQAKSRAKRKPAHARGYQSLPPTIKVWKRPDEDSFTYTQNDDGEITTLGQKTPLPKLSVGESRVKAMCDAYNKASVMNGSVSCCFLYLY